MTQLSRGGARRPGQRSPRPYGRGTEIILRYVEIQRSVDGCTSIAGCRAPSLETDPARWQRRLDAHRAVAELD